MSTLNSTCVFLFILLLLSGFGLGQFYERCANFEYHCANCIRAGCVYEKKLSNCKDLRERTGRPYEDFVRFEKHCISLSEDKSQVLGADGLVLYEQIESLRSNLKIQFWILIGVAVLTLGIVSSIFCKIRRRQNRSKESNVESAQL